MAPDLSQLRPQPQTAERASELDEHLWFSNVTDREVWTKVTGIKPSSALHLVCRDHEFISNLRDVSREVFPSQHFNILYSIANQQMGIAEAVDNENQASRVPMNGIGRRAGRS